MLNKICLSFLLNAFLERFLKAWGISFQTFTPIQEKELANHACEGRGAQTTLIALIKERYLIVVGQIVVHQSVSQSASQFTPLIVVQFCNVGSVSRFFTSQSSFSSEVTGYCVIELPLVMILGCVAGKLHVRHLKGLREANGTLGAMIFSLRVLLRKLIILIIFRASSSTKI